ncbi:MAG: alpha/beta hydrolase, partial [Flavisolibacter sp.]|nr:alpha/beta hydrolase [Flavisolibacter sp.]
LICPGGGFERLSHIYNGFQVARWFNANGINAFVLIYRLPHQTDLKDRPIAPLQDAQRAMRIIRGNAKQWGVQPDKIGIFGTSAGGHVASTLGTHFQDVSTINDSLDAINHRADFMVLVSPVISMGTFAHPGSKKNLLGAQPSKEGIEKYSNELQVSSATPPAFIVHALNDSTVPVQNSLLFYQALVDKKVNATLHIFPQGGHGIKMYDNPGSTDLFPQLLLLWLREKGYLTTKN